MRKYNSKNQIWYDESDESVRIGFTQSFLDTLDQCWHILPSNTEKFKLKAPLLTVETNDALISIMSPVAGNFMNYSDKAQNFPDRLIESDVIMELSLRPVVRPQVARQPVPRIADWAEEPIQARPRAPQPPQAQARGATPRGFQFDGEAAAGAPGGFRNDVLRRIAEQAQAHQAEVLRNIERNG
jgi:glycine cleavage system H lipoate-binding protein